MPAFENTARFRLLVIEDNAERLKSFRAWTVGDLQIVWARSAGAALGLIQRDSGYVYGGVLLDHDLTELAITEADLGLSGTQVADALIQFFSPDVPILVHSTNIVQALRVVSRLEGAGFWVTHIPMHQLTRDAFACWTNEAKELWETNQDEF